jgi:hypothetical protein
MRTSLEDKTCDCIPAERQMFDILYSSIGPEATAAEWKAPGMEFRYGQIFLKNVDVIEAKTRFVFNAFTTRRPDVVQLADIIRFFAIFLGLVNLLDNGLLLMAICVLAT